MAGRSPEGGRLFLGPKPKNLLDVLIHQKKVKESDVFSWRNLDNAALEGQLRKANLASAEDIARAFGVCYSLPYVSLKDVTITREALQAIPEDLAKELKIIAYELSDKPLVGRTLKIALANPACLTEDVKHKIDDLEKKKGLKIEASITTLDDFTLAHSRYESATSEASQTPAVKPLENSSTPAQTTLPIIDLRKVIISHDAIIKFPEDIARKYKMVVFESPNPTLIKVALGEPENPKVKELIKFVQEKNNIKVEEYQAIPDDVLSALKYYKDQPLMSEEKKPEVPKDTEDEETIKLTPLAPLTPSKPKESVPEIAIAKDAKPLVLPQNNLDTFLGTTVKTIEELEAIAQENNVPRTVAAMVALATFKKASDIHIEPTEKNLKVRYRIDGILKDIIMLPLEIHPAVVSRIKILSSLKIDENRVPQDGRFDVITNGHSIDFRVSTLPTVHGEKIALRILDKSARLYTMEEMGLTGRNLKVLTENIDKPFGTILSTGPTGSGKSTTLYAILNRISTASVNIVTLEDPVEYEIPGVNQCQIKPKIGFTFANGLRSILRQDPNVIMVGEIRDSETAALAVHAALTGHLVLSTLHTNDAAGALLRLINMGVEPFLITSSINVVIAQRLVRKLCPKCKAPAHIPEPIFQVIEKELAGFNFPKPYQFFEGRGCGECEQGYKGRIGIFEVMPMSEEIEGLASARKQSSEIKAAAVKQGMTTMKQDGLIKALKGQTTVNEVLRVISV